MKDGLSSNISPNLPTSPKYCSATPVIVRKSCNTKPPIFPQTLVPTAYEMWLSGHCLRQIGLYFGVSKDTIHNALRRRYGANATSIDYNSLYKTVVRDHGQRYRDIARPLVGIRGKYESSYATDGHIRNHVHYSEEKHAELLYEQRQQPQSYTKPFSLHYYIALLDGIVVILDLFINAERVQS